jgi:hypothetical protein
MMPPSREPARSAPAARRVSQSASSFADNRPVAVAQRSLQEAADRRLSHRQPSEAEFRENPGEFLKTNVLSLTMPVGMSVRSSSNSKLNDAYSKFVAKLGSFNKHWFKLVPDPSRTKSGRNAYILTPAIEKYLQAFPEDALLSPLRADIEAALPLEADAAYITSAYVDYKTGAVTGNVDASVGHATITTGREHEAAFNPDFVFTAAMNGCAFAVTPSETEGHFTAWHFQSSTENRAKAATFRQARNPMDWYGVEEYDDDQHEGVFEVTNFLHRGADNQWSVISQQNETAALSMDEIAIKKVHKRPLHMGAGNMATIIKRIYGPLQKSKNGELRHSLANVVKVQACLSPDMQTKLRSLITQTTRLLDSEESQLATATSLAELNTVGQAILASRATHKRDITSKAKEIEDYMDAKEVNEKRKWKFRRNVSLLDDCTSGLVNIALVIDYYTKAQWINTLITETTAPA